MNRLNRRQQLKIIEGLCYVFEGGDTKDADRAKEILGDIYKIAHLNGDCENPHEDWHLRGFKWVNELAEMGICKIPIGTSDASSMMRGEK